MFDHKRIGEDFSRAALRYDEVAGLQRHVLVNLVGKARDLLPAQGMVLDAGCGTGRLASLLPAHHLTQLDAAFAMCAFAARNDHPAVNGDIASLPFKDSAFDGAFCSLVLQWLADPEPALAEMQRVVKQDGVVAVATLGVGTLHELAESFAAADGHAHVTPFADIAHEQSESVVEYYPGLVSLMQHLKTLGARNKLSARRKSLMTARMLAKAEAHYWKHFGSGRGLRVTWNVLYRVQTA